MIPLNNKIKSWPKICVSVIVAGVIASFSIYVHVSDEGFNASDQLSASGKPAPKVVTMAEGFDPKISEKNASLAKGISEGSEMNGMDEVDSVLAEFELTGNEAFLRRAQRLFPDNLNVIILSSVWADSADSEWLLKLESLQPNNALTNLIRASFYAEEHNFEKFSEEMEGAMAKPDLDAGLKQSYARIIDELLKAGKLPIDMFDNGQVGGLMDGRLANRIGRIDEFLLENEGLFPKTDAVNSIELAWFRRLQSMEDGLNLTIRWTAQSYESKILARYPDEELYDREGLTVGERKEAIRREGNMISKKYHEYYNYIARSSWDPQIKRQFLARVASNGELEAATWLIGQ